MLKKLPQKGEQNRLLKVTEVIPHALCTSVNEVVVHGMPSERVLIEGDIVGLDFGVYYRGFFGDATITLPVGKVAEKAAKLIAVTEQSLYSRYRASERR